MGSWLKRGNDARRARAALGLGAMGLVALAPAAAEAVIVPQVPVPKPVSVRSAPQNSAPSPTSAPLSAPAPAASSGSSGGGSTRGSTSAAPPEASQPGANVPATTANPYPKKPSPFSPACSQDLDCLVPWHDWYTLRAAEVALQDKEAAALLRQDLQAVDHQISNLKGQDPDDDEPVAPAEEPGSVFGSDGAASQQEDNAAPAGPSGLTARITSVASIIIPDAISGADPRWRDPTDLGTVDLSGVGTFLDMISGGTLGLILNGQSSTPKSTTVCPKKAPDGKVPTCKT